MIIEKLKEKHGFTNSEKIIADYILKNPFDIMHLTASNLGDVTYTSKATVFRLCKKLNVDSYDEFKYRIELEMSQINHLNELLKEEPFNKNSTLNDVINILPSFYDTAINYTKLALDDSTLKRIIIQLNKSDKIDIYSSGITSSCATAAMFKFLSIGKECTSYTAVNEHYIMSAKGKKIVAILLSFTGCNPGIVRIAEYLKEFNVYTIGIGGLKTTELKDCCDEYIEIYQKDLVMSLEMMTPFISMTYIFDILFSGLLVRNYDKHLSDALEVIKLEKKINK